MNKNSTGVITVILVSLLCGLPGLVGLCIGPLAILGSVLPESSLDNADKNVVIISGTALVCLSLIFIGIPVVLGILTLVERSQPLSDLEELIPEDDF